MFTFFPSTGPVPPLQLHVLDCQGGFPNPSTMQTARACVAAGASSMVMCVSSEWLLCRLSLVRSVTVQSMSVLVYGVEATLPVNACEQPRCGRFEFSAFDPRFYWNSAFFYATIVRYHGTLRKFHVAFCVVSKSIVFHCQSAGLPILVCVSAIGI